MPGDEPPWLVGKVDQRVAMVTQGIKLLSPEVLEHTLLVTPLSEPPPLATAKQRDMWERTCDACGAFCPYPTPFYTGAVQRMIGEVPLALTFGVCAKHQFGDAPTT